MRILFITIIFFLINLTSISQIDSINNKIYEFINNAGIIETEGDTYLHKNGSADRLLNGYGSLDFDFKQCMFIDKRYYFDTVFWEINLNQEDKNYIVAQILELKYFKWEKERINKDIKLISGKETKKYSRKAMKFCKGNLDSKQFSFKTVIRYSAPVFNRKHNIALVYTSLYSGPESAWWGIYIFLLISGNWICIGNDTIGMS